MLAVTNSEIQTDSAKFSTVVVLAGIDSEKLSLTENMPELRENQPLKVSTVLALAGTDSDKFNHTERLKIKLTICAVCH